MGTRLVGLPNKGHFLKGAQELDIIYFECKQLWRSYSSKLSQHSCDLSDKLVISELKLLSLAPTVVLLQHLLLATLSILAPFLEHTLSVSSI